MSGRLGVALLLGVLVVAEANLLGSLRNHFDRAHLSAAGQVGKLMEKMSEDNAVNNMVRFAVVRSNKDEICWDPLGCFSLKAPWVSLARPLPVPRSPEDVNVNFYLYTRDTNQRYSIFDSPTMTTEGSTYDPNRPTFFITHGYLNNGNMSWQDDLKNAILNQVDGNVFITDWGPGSFEPNYLQAAANTRVVGSEIALLGKTLIERYGTDPQKFHLLGHSLGAHISGYAARDIGNVGRVTAFDPAGPGFEALPRLVRLSKHVATFVDVLHTNAKPITSMGFGMMAPVGHVDFYLNGGDDQPGCATPNVNVPKRLKDLITVPASIIQKLIECSHARSVEYFTEALKNPGCRIWGHKTSTAKNRLKWKFNIASKVEAVSGKCEAGRCVPIGLDTPLFPARGNFYAATNSRAPFCIQERSDDGQSLDELKALGLHDKIDEVLDDDE